MPISCFQCFTKDILIVQGNRFRFDVFIYIYNVPWLYSNCPLLNPPSIPLVTFLFPNNPSFVFMSFFVNIESAQKRKHVIVVFLSLAYFTWCNDHQLDWFFPQVTWVHSSLWLNKIQLCVWHIFFIQSSVDGHLRDDVKPWLLGVQMSLWSADLDSFRYRPRNNTAAKSGVSPLRHLRSLHPDFPNDCPVLYLYQQCLGVRKGQSSPTEWDSDYDSPTKTKLATNGNSEMGGTGAASCPLPLF